MLLILKNVAFREPFVERCRDCGRDVRCVRQKNEGEIAFAVINRVSYANGSYKRSEVLVNFDNLQAISGILHLREIFCLIFNMSKLLIPHFSFIFAIPKKRNQPLRDSLFQIYSFFVSKYIYD